MYNQEKYREIERKIKQLSSTQIEELFKILTKNNCKYTLNNNGVFLNLSWLEEDLLKKIEIFIDFCNESKKEVDKYEKICKKLNETLYDKSNNKDTELIDDEKILLDDNTTIEVVKKLVPKVSSSMKFYLLKKKFSRNSNINQNIIASQKDRQLFKDETLINKK
jgi:hypothetical protein